MEYYELSLIPFFSTLSQILSYCPALYITHGANSYCPALYTTHGANSYCPALYTTHGANEWSWLYRNSGN